MNLFVLPKGLNLGPLTITFYAICIIVGAVVTFKLSQHFMKKKGYDPATIENLFYIAFPAGILGARLWWIIAEGQPFLDFYKIWEGGLAIQGGVLFGGAVGIAFMLIRRKNIPVLQATDCIVPCILIAQAIGRWGNFFNQEVYGQCVDKWTFLPSFITDRLTYVLTTNSQGEYIYSGFLCGDASKMVVPLFLIESVINTIGFFVLMFGIPALFKFLSKKTNNIIRLADGDLMCGYLIWYGVVRVIMEPLRNEQFIMGSDKGVAQSMVMSIIFIVLGVLGIVFCHLFDKFWTKRKVLSTNVIDGSEASENAIDISELNDEENKD